MLLPGWGNCRNKVAYKFSFYCLKWWLHACVHAKSLQSCPTFFDPMDCSPPAPLSMGLSRQEYWSGLPFPFPGDPPSPGIDPKFPALAGGFFTTSITYMSVLWNNSAVCFMNISICRLHFAKQKKQKDFIETKTCVKVLSISFDLLWSILTMNALCLLHKCLLLNPLKRVII